MDEISEAATRSFNVNFDSLLEKYEDQGMYKLYHKQKFLISLEDGMNCPAYIIIFHTDEENDNQMGFCLIMEEEKIVKANLNIDFSLTINKKNQGSINNVKGKFMNYDDETGKTVANVFGIRHFFNNKIKRLKSVKGKMTISFDCNSKFSYHKEFIKNLASTLLTSCGKEDFTIVCGDKKIKFEKQLLINVSPVFRRMLESPWTEQSKSGHVEIKEVKPETILAFKNLLNNGDDFKKKDLNVEIMIFADRYDIKALFNLCVKHLDSFDVNNENIFDTIQALCLIKHETFFKKGILLLKKHYGALKQDPRWKEFAKNHWDCVLEMLELLVQE